MITPIKIDKNKETNTLFKTLLKKYGQIGITGYKTFGINFPNELNHNPDKFIPSQIPYEFLTKYRDHINWDKGISSTKFPLDFIEENKDFINWRHLQNGNFPHEYDEDFIRKHDKYIHFDIISSYKNLSMNFLKDYKGKIDWFCYVQQTQDKLNEFNERKTIALTEDFIENCVPQICWRSITNLEKLSEEFIEKHFVFFHTQAMESKDLSKEFIIKHKDKLISKLPLLLYNHKDIELILDIFKNTSIDWLVISKRQDLSKDFILKHKTRLSLDREGFYKDKEFSNDIIKSLGNYFHWDLFSENSIVTRENVKEFNKKINWLLLSTNHENICPTIIWKNKDHCIFQENFDYFLKKNYRAESLPSQEKQFYLRQKLPSLPVIKESAKKQGFFNNC